MEQRIYQSENIEEIFLDRHGREFLTINEDNLVLPPKAETRGDVLLSAHKTINGKRQSIYGTPEDNFEIIGLIWQIIDQYKPDSLSNSANVALKMMGMKFGRIIANPYDLDSHRDLCGYDGILTDMVKAQDKEKD